MNNMGMFRNQISEKGAKGRLLRYRKELDQKPEKIKSDILKVLKSVYTASNRVPNSNAESIKQKYKDVKALNMEDRSDRDEMFNLFREFFLDDLDLDVSSIDKRGDE